MATIPPGARAEKPVVFVPHPDDLEEVRQGLAEAERGEGVTLTLDEVDRWATTGDLPEQVERWVDPKSSSPRAT